MWPKVAASSDEVNDGRFSVVLGAVLYGASGIVVLATSWLLPDGVDRAPLNAFATGAVALAVALPYLPWRTKWTPVAIVLAAHVHLGAAGWLVAGSIEHYLPLYVLSYLYLGMTQPYRVALGFAPLTVASFLAATRDGTENLVNFVVTLPVGLVGAGVVANLLARERLQAAEIGGVLDATKRLVAATTIDEAAIVVGELATNITNAGSVAVLVADTDQPARYVARMRSESLEALGVITIDIEDEPTGIAVALRSGETVVVPDAAASTVVSQRYVQAIGARSLTFVPLFDGELGVGVIVAAWNEAGIRLRPSSMQVLELVAAEAGPIIARLRDRERLSLEAETDPLTGLANRRTFGRCLDRASTTDALVMIDLDHFKQVNDAHGHAAGDQVLRAMAACLNQAARDGDCVARFGGEEFAVVLAGADLDGVGSFLARLRSIWAATLPLTTFSTGFAVRDAAEAPLLTLGRADAALYEAKARGRDTDVEASLVLPSDLNGAPPPGPAEASWPREQP